MKSPDLIGQQFGSWTVIRRAAKRANNVYWVCRCTCGETGEVPTARLTQGKSLHCKQCAFKHSGTSRRTNRLGLRLGRLVITAEIEPGVFECLCDCGSVVKATWANLRQSKRSCGCLRRDRPNQPPKLGPSKPYLTKDGYLRVRAGKRLTYAHVIVMEYELGRRLLRGENVHHKDGDRLNNLASNLELWTTQQPSGQRVEDKVAWARELLALYGDLFPEG